MAPVDFNPQTQSINNDLEASQESVETTKAELTSEEELYAEEFEKLFEQTMQTNISETMRRLKEDLDEWREWGPKDIKVAYEY